MKDSYRRIWDVVSRIPSGKVATYGQVAEQAGFPRGARLVGHALRDCPSNGDIPWHRVVNSQGRISLPSDSASYCRQRERLLEEGVEFVAGKIDIRRFGWLGSLDELLWKPRKDWDE